MNTRANKLQEDQFHHTKPQSIPDIFSSNSRPVSGKTTSVTRPATGRPITAGSQTQLRYIRPQSTRGNVSVNAKQHNSSNFVNPDKSKKLNSSFIEEVDKIESKLLF